MSKKCQVTGRRAMYGNTISHAHNRSRRRFDINLQTHRLWDANRNQFVKLRVSTRALRTIDKHGGLAAYRRALRKKGKPVTF